MALSALSPQRVWIHAALGFALAVTSGGRAAADAGETAPPRPAPAPVSLRGAWKVLDTYLPSTKSVPRDARSIEVPSNWYQRGWDRDGQLWFVREVELKEAAAWRLEFEGVDYECEVFWDGVSVGGHTGYFAPFALAVPGGAGQHVLAVRVDSPRETTRDWSLHKRLIKGVLGHHDTRPGGAWSVEGQDANTGGIWGDVRVTAATTAWIDRPMVTTATASAASATLELAADIAPMRDGPVTVRWQVIAPRGATVAEGTWRGRGRLTARAELAAPALWWPREYGASPLYRAVFTVGADQRAVRFGVRTVEKDVRSRYKINGVPVFLRGTNYIGSLYLASLDRTAVRRDLELMIQANINAIRVHAHVTSPAFYELADELGLLVWQDFPLQWGYDDSPAFAAEAARQLREMLSSLGHHPSVIHWTAQNEAPWSSSWMVYKYPTYDPDQNRLLSTTLADVLAEDPTRPSQANSGTGEHAWMGWYSGHYREFNQPQAHPILTEYGAQALPNLATLRTILRPDQLWPLDPNLSAWQYHNFQKHELVDLAKVPLGGSLASLISNTQAYQARLLQFAAEGLRRQMWQPITGIFQFMFVEHWPSMSWGVVDYRRIPKPGWEALRRAYQPVLPIAYAYRKDALRLHIVNDRPKAENVTVLVTRELGGKVQYRRRFAHHLAVSSVSALPASLTVPSRAEALRILVIGPSNLILSENYYAPGYFAE
ncbi:MAG: glycoside hydrolase family 2 TIM barrel-domain containing protein [Kofleriaceae bacterium]